MVLTAKPIAPIYTYQILPQNCSTKLIRENIQVYDASQRTYEDDILAQGRLRLSDSPVRQNTYSPINSKKESKTCLSNYRPACNTHQYINTSFCLKMSIHVFKTENSIDPQSATRASNDTFKTSSNCYKMQSEFRRCGWNVAGANLLAVACWMAQTHFLYARPRLTGLDFGIATMIAAGCGIIAR